MIYRSIAAALGFTLLAGSSNAQIGQSPFLARSRPCPCVDSCIYAFDGPELPNFDLPDRGQSDAQINRGNPIVSADGSGIRQGCNGDDTSYLNDNLEWISTIPDDNGQRRDIDVFFATSEDGLFTRRIQDNVFAGYQSEVSGRLLKTQLQCNNGDRGCVYYTIDADDFVCPCPIDIDAPLSTDQEILGGVVLNVPSEGSGVGSVQYNPLNRVMKWDIQTQDLSSDLVQLHFHGPASRVMGGPLQINATAVGNPPLGMTGSVFLDEDQGRDLVNGLWYINVHTELNPSGELRGQIVEPDINVDLSVDLELLGGVVLMEPSEGSGIGRINYDPEEQLLFWDIETQDLSSDLVQIHFHGPATPIMGGALQINATNVGVPPLGMVGAATLSNDQARDFEAGMWYINIHTESNPSGELRGNIVEPDAVISCTVDQETAGGVVLNAPSQGSGTGLLNYNPDTRLFVWDIRTQDLSSDLVQLHFHGPASTNMGGPLQLNATAIGIPPFGMVGATTLSQDQARDIENEMWYINVHTEANPSGELRGNILAPELNEPLRIASQQGDDAVAVAAAVPVEMMGGVAAAAGVVLLGGTAFAIRRKRKKSKQKKEEDERAATLNRKVEAVPPRRLSGDGNKPRVLSPESSGPGPAPLYMEPDVTGLSYDIESAGPEAAAYPTRHLTRHAKGSEEI